jgi:hypothetical protein
MGISAHAEGLAFSLRPITRGSLNRKEAIVSPCAFIDLSRSSTLKMSSPDLGGQFANRSL